MGEVNSLLERGKQGEKPAFQGGFCSESVQLTGRERLVPRSDAGV